MCGGFGTLLNFDGVSFDEAKTAFSDHFAHVYEDEYHPDDEPREILIGYSERNRLLVVAFIIREPIRVRLITARLATRRGRRIYGEGDFD